MWMAWLTRRLPRSDSRWTFPVPGGRLDRGGAVIGGEVIASGEAGHVGHVTDDGAGDHRANAEDPGEGSAGALDRGGQLLAGVA
jgi:hypothetical protein